MRVWNWIIAGAVSFVATAQCSYAETYRFDVAPGLLGEALVPFGQQAGISIGLTDPQLALSNTRGVKGRYDIAHALRILLRGTGAKFRTLAPRTYRLVKAPLPSPKAAPPPQLSENDIIVTASKQLTPLSQFPGTATVISFGRDSAPLAASKGTGAIIELLPVLTSTELGPGRNKIFIRGIADSSFNGPTQSATGFYLGDARLSYNSPDPNLNLFDMQQVEVLEGPQGTLYGNETIGGVIRFVPVAPAISDAEGHKRGLGEVITGGSFAAGVTTTQHGGIGDDGAVAANLLIAPDILAVRAVAYQSYDAGYINDPLRGLNQINSTATSGGRIAARWAPSSTLRVDAGAVYQNIQSADSNYVYLGAPDLTRSSRLAQPFGNRYMLGYLTVKLDHDRFTMTSTTSAAIQKMDISYDATDYSNLAIAIQNTIPKIFLEDDDITLISHETRLIGSDKDHPWIFGISGLFEEDLTDRNFGDPELPTRVASLRDNIGEAAIFGEYGVPLAHNLKLTFGVRTAMDVLVGHYVVDSNGSMYSDDRTQFFLLPTLAVEWRKTDSFVVFGRLSESSRPGGLTIDQTKTGITSTEFGSDTLNSGEFGFRVGRQDISHLWGIATISYATWRNIQSDLITGNGIPYTVNIGNGYVYGLEARGGWSPSHRFAVTTAMFFNKSSLSTPLPQYASDGSTPLPNIAGSGAHIDGSYRLPLGHDMAITFHGAVRYVGKSRLGIGELFDSTQGDFTTETANARLSWRALGLSLNVDNLSNVRSNQFAFGNPFGIASDNQITPLRPRTIRLGIDGRF